MATTRAAGDEIDAYCTKCKLVLAHTIVAMKANKVVRVECKTCKGVHAYRASVPGSKKKKSGSKITDYEKLISGMDLSRAKRYAQSTKFEQGEIIDHSHFGLGLITQLKGGGKIEVIFPNGTKTLIHGRA